MRKLIYIIAFCFLANISYAQDDGRNKIMSFSDFSGGLATKLSDQSTNPKYARIAENIRLGTVLKALSKRDMLYEYGSASGDEPVKGMHRLYLVDLTKYLLVNHGKTLSVGNDNTGVFTDIATYTYPDYRWQWLTWHDLAIGCDGYNSPIKTDGADSTYLGALYAETSGAGGGGPVSGDLTYKVSCHATTQAIELDQVSNTYTADTNDVNLSMIPISPDTIGGEAILYRKVYRNKAAALTTWYLLSNGKISNNTATTLTDSDVDAALGAEEYGDNPASVTAETWEPPVGRLSLVHRDRLWFANNPDHPSRIYYSDTGSYDFFDPLGYYDIRKNDGDEITFIKNLLGILTVGKTNTIQKLYTTGDDPDADWEISDPFSFIGCDAPYSAVNTPVGVFYLSRSRSGIYVFNGQNSMLKSEQVTPVIQDILNSNLSNVWGEYNNNIYYMTYPSLTEGGSTNNRVLVYDMLADAYTIDTLSLNCLLSLTGSADGGELIGGSSLDGAVYNFQTSALSIVHNKHSDFVGVHCQANTHTEIGVWCHARYIPVSIGGNPNSPVLEIAWHDTVDEQQETVDGRRGIVDRSAGNGSYISSILNTAGASAYDKLYWNEILPSDQYTETHVAARIRGGNTHTECLAGIWSAEYNTASGSDLSGLTAYPYTQYQLLLGTNLDLTYSPNIYTLGGYTVKLTFNKVGTAAESTIGFHYQTGFLDFGVPGYTKVLRKVVVYLEGENGELDITFTNENGNSDSFTIDMATNPNNYYEYFTTGAFTGTKFKMDIENSDLNALTVKEVILVMDISPIF